MSRKSSKPKDPADVSKYFLRGTPTGDLKETQDNNSGAMATSTASNATAAAQDGGLKAMEDRLIAALQSLETKLEAKLDKSVEDLKADFSARLEKMSATVDKTCQKVTDIEASLNFAHLEITSLKTVTTQLEKTNKRLQERVSEAEKKVRSLEKQLEETEDKIAVNMNHIERRSRDYNIRVRNATISDDVNYVEQVASLIVKHKLAPEGNSAEDVVKQIETAHPLKTKGQMIARFHSRPYRNHVVQQAKQRLNKTTPKDGLKIVEDLTKVDFQKKMKALPQMQKAFEEGKKAKFYKGNLIINGKMVDIAED